MVMILQKWLNFLKGFSFWLHICVLRISSLEILCSVVFLFEKFFFIAQIWFYVIMQPVIGDQWHLQNGEDLIGKVIKNIEEKGKDLGEIQEVEARYWGDDLGLQVTKGIIQGLRIEVLEKSGQGLLEEREKEPPLGKHFNYLSIFILIINFVLCVEINTEVPLHTLSTVLSLKIK